MPNTRSNTTTAPLAVIAGPTASGKSALALALAEAHGGTIINADSMQVYRDLRVLTARPTTEDEARTPHTLYGVLDGGEACSAARWVALAQAAIAATHDAGRLPILVGGTGLYLRALLQGLGGVPTINPDIRAAVRAMPLSAVSEALAMLDPQAHTTLKPGDSQRRRRALEVVHSTGKTLTAWHAASTPQPWRGPVAVAVLDPPRPWLRARCDARFETMLDHGALDEVKALAARALPEDAPIMGAIGVRPLMAYLQGALPLDEAVTKAKAATRQYAKRQGTWFRHQRLYDNIMTLECLSETQMKSLLEKFDRILYKSR